MPSKPAIAVIAALFALSAAGIAFAGGSPDLAPRPLLVSAGDKSVTVQPGTSCTTSVPNEDGEGVSQCTDFAAPTRPPRYRLRVHPRQLIQLRFEDNPEILDEVKRVFATPVHISRKGLDFHPQTKRPHAIDADRRIWQFRLPRRLHHANALDVFVRLDPGDVSYTAGLRRLRPRGAGS